MDRPSLPPRSRETSPDGAPARERRPDVREWLGSIRFSGFMVIMLGLVVLAVFVLVPTVGLYVDQRQQIGALRDAVALSESEVADLEAQRDRWSDPAYITTQARERLYYFKPGEVVYLVDNDLPPEALPREEEPVSDDVEQTRTDWMSQLVRSVASAGLAQPAVADPEAPLLGAPEG